MQTIQDSIDIPASTAAVWRGLTATQHYGASNLFIRRLDGELRTGERLPLTMDPPGAQHDVHSEVARRRRG